MQTEEDRRAWPKAVLTFALYQGDALVRRETVTQDIVKVGKDPKSHLRVDDELRLAHARGHRGGVARGHHAHRPRQRAGHAGERRAGQQVQAPRRRPDPDRRHADRARARRAGGSRSPRPPRAAAGARRANPFAAAPAARIRSRRVRRASNPFGGGRAPNPFAAASNPFAAARPSRSAPFAQRGARRRACPTTRPRARTRTRWSRAARTSERRGRDRARAGRRGDGALGHERAPRLAPHAAAHFYVGEEQGKNFALRLLHPVARSSARRACRSCSRDRGVDQRRASRRARRARSRSPGQPKMTLDEASSSRAQPCAELARRAADAAAAAARKAQHRAQRTSCSRSRRSTPASRSSTASLRSVDWSGAAVLRASSLARARGSHRGDGVLRAAARR